MTGSDRNSSTTQKTNDSDRHHHRHSSSDTTRSPERYAVGRQYRALRIVAEVSGLEGVTTRPLPYTKCLQSIRKSVHQGDDIVLREN